MIADLVYQTFLWLDAPGSRYWTAAWICVAGLLLTSLYPYQPGVRGRQWNQPWLYLTTLGLALLAFRWPMMAAGAEFNPDESQLLAGALTTWQRHVVGSIDMGYCGPWAFLPLMLPALFGFPIDYLGGRCVAWLMTGASVALLWLTLRHVLSDRPARLVVLPVAVFFALTSFEDFVQYSGEQSPQLYFSAALWLLVTAFAPPSGSISRLRLLGGGFFLGVLPFSKLQAAPLGVLLGGLCLLALFLQPGRRRGQRLQDAAWLVGGVLLSAGLTLGVIAASGSWFHFYQSYLVTGLAYAGHRGFDNAQFLAWVWQFAQTSRGLAPFVGTACAAILIALPFCTRLAPGPRRLLLPGGLLALGGLFVVWAPGRTSSHYLLFLVVPLGFLLALLYGGLIFRPDQSRSSHFAWLLLFLGLTVAPQVYARHGFGAPEPLGTLRESREEAAGPLVRFLQPLIRPGDTLTIWGWACTYHVQTQLPQGTREGHTERQIVVGPAQEYFRARFLANLEQERPTFFLDAVGVTGFRFTDRNVFGHDRWSALQILVNTHYRQVGERENVRIYLRRDRIAEQAAELKILAPDEFP
ncbi:MAG: hypothetical protein PSV13_03205 [Lacunisphaera sp.]|nr:hypothetical protein [Lacunisphaera sp.]